MTKYYVSRTDLTLIKTEAQIVSDLQKDFEEEYMLVEAGFIPESFQDIINWVLKVHWMPLLPQLIAYAGNDLTAVSNLLKEAVAGTLSGIPQRIAS